MRGFNHPTEEYVMLSEKIKIMKCLWLFGKCLCHHEGLEINYNFNRKHMSLGKKTSAEVAIPQLELGVNKWLDLIKLSKI